jgi:oligosaccharyltransferase complex subunit alpha (ribophorin I)
MFNQAAFSEFLDHGCDGANKHEGAQAPAQNEHQALGYDTDLFVLSPFKTLVQRTKFKLVIFLIDIDTVVDDFITNSTVGFPVLGYTEPKKVSFTTGSIAIKSNTGGTVTYGPFSDLPPSSNTAFVEKYQQKISVHYEFGFPMLAIRSLQRTAEVSHWGANLNFQDEIHLYNAGPK